MAVDQHNHDIFHKSTNEKVKIKAIDIVLGDLSDELKGRLKKQILLKPWACTQFVPYLKMQNMTLRQTVSVVDGMTNGAECIIKKVDYRVLDSTKPSIIIWVLFQKEHIGKDCCKEYSHLYNQSIDRYWVPILEVTRQFRRHQMQVLCRQFPLRPFAAKTIRSSLSGRYIK